MCWWLCDSSLLIAWNEYVMQIDTNYMVYLSMVLCDDFNWISIKNVEMCVQWIKSVFFLLLLLLVVLHLFARRVL